MPSVAIATETLLRLAEHPQIVANKDAKGDLFKAQQVMSRCELVYYSGDDALNLPLVSVGAVGAVSVTGHLVADRIAAMVIAHESGDVDLARELNDELVPVTEAIMTRTQGVIAVKAALEHQGRPGGGALRLPLLPMFLVYFISGVAETNRAPFDVVEGESEIVAGHMVEYSGMSFAMFFLAEYANMWLVSILAAVMFLGGWLPPIDSALFNWIPGWIWLGLKTCAVVTLFIWIRATLPRFRYDQIMRLGWKIFIPLTLVWLIVIGIWIQTPFTIWK